MPNAGVIVVRQDSPIKALADLKAAGLVHQVVPVARRADVAPIAQRHLDADLHRSGAVVRIKNARQTCGQNAHKIFGKPNRRFVRESGQDDMFQRLQLCLERSVDARVGMAEQVHPPRTDPVQIALAIEIDQPCALTPRHRNERQGFVVFHLGAGVPDGGEAAAQESIIIHGDIMRDLATKQKGPVIQDKPFVG